MIRLLCLVITVSIGFHLGDTWAQEPAEFGSLQAQPTRLDILTAAKEAEAAKEFDRAAGLYRDYLQRRPEDDEVKALLARILSWQGQHEEAVTLYRDILTRHPVDIDVRIALARVRSWQQHFDESAALYRAVLNEDPKNIEAKQGLADTLYWSKRYQEALPLYQEVSDETHDPEIAYRIVAVTQELALSPRAPVGTRIWPALPFRDYAKLGYSHYTYTNGFPDERNGLIEAARPIGDMTFVGRVEPLNRFGRHDTPLSGELYSPLWSRAWGYLSALGTINPSFAPNWTLGGELFQGLGGLSPYLAPVELSFGYRHLRFKQDSINLLEPGVTIYLPFNFWLTEKIYYVPDQGSITFSSQLTWRPTDRIQLFAAGGFGTSGERFVAVRDFVRVPSRIIQGGAIFPITERFSGEVLGYYEDRSALYVRRGVTFNLIWHW